MNRKTPNSCTGRTLQPFQVPEYNQGNSNETKNIQTKHTFIVESGFQTPVFRLII